MVANNPLVAAVSSRQALDIARTWAQTAIDKLNEKDVLGTWDINARDRLEVALNALDDAAEWLAE